MPIRSCTQTFALLSLAAVAFSSIAQAQTQYSDKDKKKLGEIAQRPEVQASIDKAWADARRADMQFAYNVNQSIELSRSAPSVFADYRVKYGELYDNPALARYLTTIGQRLVPAGSNNLYAFRILLDPVPRAESISTGTVYVSSGLVAMLDNEAQLSYVLGHEIAHIEKTHQYERIRNSILEEKLGEEKEADVAKKKAIFSAVTEVAAIGIGGAAGGLRGAAIGGLAGVVGGSIAAHFLFRNRFEPTDWSVTEENEADQLGIKYMLDQNFDPREAPKLLARMNHMVSVDSRVGLGFMGDSKRVKERIGYLQTSLNGEYKSAIEQRLKSGGLQGASLQFSLLMADLKRDNGIAAIDYDLFAMAKDNLLDAISLRSDDSRAQGALGRLLATTAQTPDDRKEAMNHTLLAIKYDNTRGAYPDPYLDVAVTMMNDKGTANDPEVARDLKAYVVLYQRDHGGALPGNVLVIYDYLSQNGDTSFFLPPASTISNRPTGPVSVQTAGASTIPDAPTLVKAVVDAAGPGMVVPVAAPAPGTPTKPAARRTSTPARPQ